MITNYYKLKELGYISNSDLSSVRSDIENVFKPKNIEDAYRVGNLTDYLITEPERVNKDMLYYKDEAKDDKVITFTQKELDLAEKMKQAYDSDEFITNTFSNAKKQHVIAREKFVINNNGSKIMIKARCKFDLLVPRVIGADIKTTAMTSQNSFIKSIFSLDYDRAAAYYMDLARIDMFMFLGICKKPNRQGKHEIFKFAIKRGSDIFIKGQAKYKHLAFVHDLMN